MTTPEFPPGQADAAAFHRDEVALQTRVGVAEKMAWVGRMAMHPYLPDQHRRFYPLLGQLFVGAADADNRLWATAVYGQPGFVSAPSEQQLIMGARFPSGDPLENQLHEGDQIALLGLEFESRRRNRANGVVADLCAGADTDVDAGDDTGGLTGSGFRVNVEQCFGNCPKYIQRRRLIIREQQQSERQAHRFTFEFLASDLVDRIQSADCFFIASRADHGVATLTENGKGVDISHRGGEPGFVKVLNNRQLVFADFAGNRFFNTLGNLLGNPHCGLLFLDFDSGDHLHLSGRAHCLWQQTDALPIPGYERNIVFTLEKAVLVTAACPWSWQTLN